MEVAFMALRFLAYIFTCGHSYFFSSSFFVLAIISSFNTQYAKIPAFISFNHQSMLGKFPLIATIGVVALNALSTFAEYGPLVCPDNPTGYWLFSKASVSQ